MATGKLTYEELTQLANELIQRPEEEAPGPSLSFSPMGKAQEVETEPEQEPEAVPQYRTVSRFLTLDGNNAAFVVLMVIETGIAYWIGKLLNAW
jgi:hypothetical protein